MSGHNNRYCGSLMPTVGVANALDLKVLSSVLRAIERDLARVPGLAQAASAVALAAYDVERQMDNTPIAASILKQRLKLRARH